MYLHHLTCAFIIRRWNCFAPDFNVIVTLSVIIHSVVVTTSDNL